MIYSVRRCMPQEYAHPRWNSWIAPKLSFLLVFLLVSSGCAQLPYNPTYLLKSSKDYGAYIYLLSPPSPSSPRGQLAAFNESSTLTTSNLSSTVISTTLPFLEDDSRAAYVPTISSNGSISVYSGNCTLRATGASLWTFIPESDMAGGSWKRQSYEVQDLGGQTILSGANYLAGAIQYSINMTETNSSTYIFGGMCPNSNSTTQSWATAAGYSNSLLQIRSSELSLVIPKQVQPIPEAGFTTTALHPTYSNVSNVLIQQQNFLLLGGQAGAAFINMSEVALLSLPQETWIYESVDASSASLSIEPRSGHSATLTADGTRVVVVGGWVGDVSTPASPQLAILELGMGYGGSNDWAWSIPSSTDSPFVGTGIYGHGAILLDEDVIVILGGYNISTASTLSKRATQVNNAQNFFYNISSQTWLSSYNPNGLPLTTNATEGTSEPGIPVSEKIGLGIGISLGLVALILLVVGSLFARRSRSRRNETRMEPSKFGNMVDTAYSQKESLYEDTGEDEKVAMIQADSVSNPSDCQQRNRDSWTWIPSNDDDNQSVDGWRNACAREVERSGVDLDIPSPRRGLRRSMYGSLGRGAYRAAIVVDDGPPTGYGNMYAIEERSDEGSSPPSRKSSANQAQPRRPSSLLDPFRDPEVVQDIESREKRHIIPRKPLPVIYTKPSLPPSVIRALPSSQHQYEVSAWIKDWAAVDALLPHGPNNSPPKSGRSSPSKSDRTDSNLSEQSRHYLHSPIPPSASPGEDRENRRSIRYSFPGLFNDFAGSISIASSSPTRSIFAENNSPPETSDKGDGKNLSKVSVDRDTSRPSLVRVRTADAESFAAAYSNIPYTHQGESDTLLNSPLTPHNGSNTILTPDIEHTFTRRDSPSRGGRSRSRSRSRVSSMVGSMRRIVSPRLLNFEGEEGLKGHHVTATSGTMSNTGTEYGDNQHGHIGASRYGDPSTTSSTSYVYADEVPRTSSLDIEVRRSLSDGAAITKARRTIREVSASTSSPSPPPSGPSSPRLTHDFVIPMPAPSPPLHARSPILSSASADLNDRLSPSSLLHDISHEGQRSNRSAISSARSGRTSIMTGASGEIESEVDWDVEAAVEERVVHQVIEAVPRERLRVVNSDPVVGRWETGNVVVDDE